MNRNIRHGVFETNSSSIHSIAIGKQKWDFLPKKVIFRGSEFGWEFDRYYTIEERASYLYTALWDKYMSWSPTKNDYIDYERWKYYIQNTLASYGVDSEFQEIKEDDFYFVDHVACLSHWLIRLYNSEELLMQYLFSPDSEIYTMNDNEDYDLPEYDGNKYLDIECKYN